MQVRPVTKRKQLIITITVGRFSRQTDLAKLRVFAAVVPADFTSDARTYGHTCLVHTAHRSEGAAECRPEPSKELFASLRKCMNPPA